MSLPNFSSYVQALAAVPFREVSFGSSTVRIFDSNQIDEAQLGYSRDSNGQSLCGRKDGDWKDEWLVIAYEDLCGDPIFIDTSVNNMPVYTAMHGQGRWEPELIADTFDGFVESLKAVKSVAAGRENPVELESNPLPNAQCEQILKTIRVANPKADTAFWYLWLNQDDSYVGRMRLVVHSCREFLRRILR